jgi:hypothetical protein
MDWEELVGVTGPGSALAVVGAEVAIGVTVASPQAERRREKRRTALSRVEGREERICFIFILFQSNSVVE